jgi:hypothetical protein
MDGKIFGIGFQKTGTKSLAAALRRLGYSVTGPNGVDDPDIASNVHQMAHRLVERYDAFQDNPWPVLYRQLDERYRGSRFILTVREPERWIRSVVAHFGDDETPMRRWIYGVGRPRGHEAVFLARYRAHNADVLAHFAERSRDLLVLDVDAGFEWEPLCRFLGKDVPQEPFPHRNRREDRRSVRGLLRRGARVLGLAGRSGPG